jgi:hypothetical protein
MAYKNKPEDFLKFVAIDPEGCWIWCGKVNKITGYGQWKMNYKDYLPHRHSYTFFKGPIPEGLTIDHSCRNRICVNPDHLEAVTSKENTMRGNTITAKNAQKTHCKRGHKFTKKNTYLHHRELPTRKWVERHCKKCNALRQH